MIRRLFRMQPRRKALIRVIYKGGDSQYIRCASFTATRRNGDLGDLYEVEWDNPLPKPLFFGIDNVAAIYQVR